MNNKVKSLIYLGCFMLAVVLYQVEENSSTAEPEPLAVAQVTEVDIIINPFIEDIGE